jgi:hypothetical protein
MSALYLPAGGQSSVFTCELGWLYGSDFAAEGLPPIVVFILNGLGKSLYKMPLEIPVF